MNSSMSEGTSPRMRTIFWQDNAVVMIDQRALPLKERYVVCTDYRQVVAAIRDMTIRGAPAIGVAAAMGIALGMRAASSATAGGIKEEFSRICTQFSASRPTARNLFWAVERMQGRMEAKMASLAVEEGGTAALQDDLRLTADKLGGLQEALVAEALSIARQDETINISIGRNGRELIPDGARILTHCNAGALATAGYGTALGVVRAAWEEGKKLHVYVDETRPVLQGARLTAWELMGEGIPCTLIADNMAAFLMSRKGVDLVVIGADRIAANGDTANKIGTYGLAVLARAHKVPFYVAAPVSTIDVSLPDGSQIPIEERDPSEVTNCGNVRVAPEGVSVWNPAFDVTPAEFVTAIITEEGIFRPPFFFVPEKARCNICFPRT